MHITNFNKELDLTLHQLKILLDSKGSEYVVEGKSRFHNFERASSLQGVPREQIMLNYSMKHFISILDTVENIRTDLPDKEVIVEKFNDMIAYLIIIKMSLLNRNDS